MRRSNRLALLVGVFLTVVAFVGIALLLSGGYGPKGTVVALPDGRTVMCVQSTSGPLTCDWERAK